LYSSSSANHRDFQSVVTRDGTRTGSPSGPLLRSLRRVVRLVGGVVVGRRSGRLELVTVVGGLRRLRLALDSRRLGERLGLVRVAVAVLVALDAGRLGQRLGLVLELRVVIVVVVVVVSRGRSARGDAPDPGSGRRRRSAAAPTPAAASRSLRARSSSSE
jgi:hypothetical protein